MSGTQDRTQSQRGQQQADRERTAIAIATERLPWHPGIQERFGIERSGWRALVESVYPSAKTVEAILLALSYCKARKLDVFKRPVHIVPIWNSELGREVETVWPGIGELRTTAMRTGEFGGFDETRFGQDITRSFSGVTGRGTNARERSVEMTFPEWAQVTTYRFVGKNGDKAVIPGPRVYWIETYSSIGRTNVPNDRWARAPRQMIEKCAEAAALRRAFPEELGNEAIAEEVGGNSEGVTINGNSEEIETQPEQTQEKPPQQRRQPPRQETETRRDPPPDAKPTEQRTDAPRGREATPEASAARSPSPEEPSHPAPSGDSGGFTAYAVSADGVETTEAPFDDAMAFAREIERLHAEAEGTAADDILELNAGAIEDACDASQEAAALINAIKTGSPREDAPREPQPLVVPTTSKGAAHWPNYADAVEADMAKLATLADVDQWIALNKPTYSGRAIEGKVVSKIRARREALGERQGDGEAVSGATEAAPAEDKDSKTIDNFIRALQTHRDINSVKMFEQASTVVTVTERLDREGRHDLVQRLTDAVEARKQELRAGA